MFIGAWEGHHRSWVKAISWRLAGSLDTLILSYLVTRSFVFAGSIASAETITKIVLYYVHERTWAAIPWGKSSRKHRALYNACSRWRTRVAQSVRTATDLASRLRNVLHPAKLAMIGSFVVCFLIVLTPPPLRLRSSTPTETLSASRQPGVEVTTAELLQPATTTTAVHPPREASDAALAQTELALALSSETPQILKETPSVENARRNLLNRDHAKEVQQRLFQLGYLSVSPTGVWGAHSRNALRAFKSDHDLAADENWDNATERSLFSGSVEAAEPFVGIWAVDASACSPGLNRKGLLPAVIDGKGAWAGETFCAFETKKHTAEGWNVVASCSNPHDRWTAKVRLTINSTPLTWTSERGSQSYLRCQPGLSVARAS